MKKHFWLLVSALLVLVFMLFTACPTDGEEDGGKNITYTSFPEEEILGASFYVADNVPSAEAGSITKNPDGTYKVRIRRRSPSLSPSAIFITGSFTFSEYYSVTCTFPDAVSITDKPYRVYACASVGMDAVLDADYPTAWDSRVFAAFRNDQVIGEVEMTNEIVNVITPNIDNKPYITVFLYLYFNNVTDPNDYYEFTLNEIKAANGVKPISPVSNVAVYRAGDTSNKFELSAPILAGFNHRYDSNTINAASPTSLNVDIKIPDADAGKEIEFEIRNVGLYSGTTNLITREMIKAAQFLPGSAAITGTVTEQTVNSTPVSYYYRIKANAAVYSDMTGIKLIIPGTFTNTNRYTITVNVPKAYMGN